MKYCVYLTVYSGNKLPPFYIGSSNMDQIEKGYHGSVRSKRYRAIWESELRKNTTAFKTTIICVFQNRKDAFDKEEKFHRSLNVVDNPLYINMAIANRRFTMNGKKHSVEANLKRSI